MPRLSSLFLVEELDLNEEHDVIGNHHRYAFLDSRRPIQIKVSFIIMFPLRQRIYFKTHAQKMKFRLLKISPASLKSNNVKSWETGLKYISQGTYLQIRYTVLELDSEERLGQRNFLWTFPRLSNHGVVKAFS